MFKKRYSILSLTLIVSLIFLIFGVYFVNSYTLTPIKTNVNKNTNSNQNTNENSNTNFKNYPNNFKVYNGKKLYLVKIKNPEDYKNFLLDNNFEVYDRNVGIRINDDKNKLINDIEKNPLNYDPNLVTSYLENNKDTNVIKSLTDRFQVLTISEKNLETQLAKAKTDAEKKEIQKQLDENKKQLNEISSIITNSNNQITFLNSMDKKQREEFNKILTSNKCGDSWYSFLCKALDKNYLDATYEKSFLTQLKNTGIYTNDKMSNEEKNKIIMNKLKEDLPSNLITSDCNYNVMTDKCYDSLTKKINDVYKNDPEKRDALLKIVQTAKNQMFIKTSVFGGIAMSLLNPDKDAENALRLLGIKANYNNVPSFLKDSFPSTICMAKISGYLDKTINGEGVTTHYTSCAKTKNGELVNSINCIKVSYDVRAERTKLTPDNKINIQYSIYLDFGEDVKYFVSIDYLQNGVLIKQPAMKEPEKYTGKIFKFYDLQINSSKGKIDKNSFVLKVVVRNNNNNLVKIIKTPIFIVSPDIYKVTWNNAGNEQAKQIELNNNKPKDVVNNDNKLSEWM